MATEYRDYRGKTFTLVNLSNIPFVGKFNSATYTLGPGKSMKVPAEAAIEWVGNKDEIEDKEVAREIQRVRNLFGVGYNPLIDYFDSDESTEVAFEKELPPKVYLKT